MKRSEVMSCSGGCVCVREFLCMHKQIYLFFFLMRRGVFVYGRLMKGGAFLSSTLFFS